MSSSEDEESLKALREATDSNFLNDNLFRSVKSSETKETDPPKVENFNKSLRKDKDEFDNFGLTQTFKNFVAKKLSDVLDRHLEEDNSFREPKKSPRKETGIKLLSSSKKRLCLKKTNDEADVAKINKKNKKRKRKRDEEEESSAATKIQEAAVSGDSILSKSDTKMWQNRRKGKEFKYKKLKNGTLIEQT